MANHKYNTDYLVPLTQKKAEVISSIEEAEWMQEDTSLLYAVDRNSLTCSLDHITLRGFDVEASISAIGLRCIASSFIAKLNNTLHTRRLLLAVVTPLVTHC